MTHSSTAINHRICPDRLESALVLYKEKIKSLLSMCFLCVLFDKKETKVHIRFFSFLLKTSHHHMLLLSLSTGDHHT